MRAVLVVWAWVFILASVAAFWTLVFVAIANAQPGESKYDKARRIVFATFPDSTQDAALRVVGCETGHRYETWAYNASGASGLFQVKTGNAGRVLVYRGETLTIRGYEKLRTGVVVNRLFNPWYNAKVALFLSHGGTDWDEWACKP